MLGLKPLKNINKSVSGFNIGFIIMFLIVLLGCRETETGMNRTYEYADVDTIYTDYLISFSDDSDSSGRSSFGYKNLQGEVIIPMGKYERCFTDTFKNFAFVYDEKITGSKVVAINRNEKILFEAYMFDNGPDWPEEGLFRIIRNGKIGYADKNGIIVIEPEFECADQFENGTARVAINCNLARSENDPEHTSMESDSWFYIDKNGNIVK